MKQIFINCEHLETRVAVVENGVLEEYKIERNDERRIVGSVYKGRVHNLAPSLQAAFIDIGLEKNAFAHYKDLVYFKTLFETKNGKIRPATKRRRQPQYKEPEKKVEVKKSVIQKLIEFFGKKEEEKKKPEPQRNNRNNNRNRQGNRQGNRKGGNRRPPAPTVSADDIPTLCPEGSEIVVQVEKGPIGTKGAKVTSKVEIPGHYLVLLPNSRTRGVSKRIEDREERKRLQDILMELDMPPNMGCICRTAGMGKKAKFFQMDMEMLLQQWDEMQEKLKEGAPTCIYAEPSLMDRALREFLTNDIDEIIVDSEQAYEHVTKAISMLSKQERGKIRLYSGSEPMFQRYKLKRQVENIFTRQVSLPSGAYICIDETEALIAVDVNSGRSTKGKDHPETILSTNLETVDEVARQLRLRNIGGLVVIDFIDMRSRKDQTTVYRAMQDALSKDRARTKVLPISRFGLMELTRQREHESLRDTMFATCPYCKGKGLIKSPTSISVEIQRRIRSIIKKRKKDLNLRVIVHPDVLARLREDDEEFLHEMERKLGGGLSFRADSSLHIETSKIINQDTGREL